MLVRFFPLPAGAPSRRRGRMIPVLTSACWSAAPPPRAPGRGRPSSSPRSWSGARPPRGWRVPGASGPDGPDGRRGLRGRVLRTLRRGTRPCAPSAAVGSRPGGGRRSALRHRLGASGAVRARRLAVAGAVALVLALLVSLGIVVSGLADAPGRTTTATVRAGQSLWEVAAATGTGDVEGTMARIVELNALESSVLEPGQVLVVPAG